MWRTESSRYRQNPCENRKDISRRRKSTAKSVRATPALGNRHSKLLLHKVAAPWRRGDVAFGGKLTMAVSR
ncbi:MAG: hypothetical protein ACLT4C_01655 [Butyricicoccus sp.]